MSTPSSSPRMLKSQDLSVRGVTENNLKNLDLSIKHDRFTVVTGVSGSGKSTLAFDTIYAEGGRRYIETFSPYTRQFLDRLHRPELDSIEGVRPALALEQRNRTTSSRSTVGTVTEINDYLKVIWAHLAELSCSSCGKSVSKDSPASIVKKILSKEIFSDATSLLVCFPLQLSGEVSPASLVRTLEGEGFLRYYSNKTHTVNRLSSLLEDLEGDGNKKILPKESDLHIVVDRITLTKGLNKKVKDRLVSSLVQAYAFGHGRLELIAPPESSAAKAEAEAEAVRLPFHEGLSCATCNIEYKEPKPSLFSFNSPLGACGECHGFGKILELDPSLIVPDPRKSVSEGAIACWNTSATSGKLKQVKEFCLAEGIDPSKPWKSLSKTAQQLILEGEKGKKRSYPGVYGWFKRLERKRHKMHVRVLLSRYRSEVTCPSCSGTRLTPTALLFTVAQRSIPDVWAMPLEEAVAFFSTLKDGAPEDPVFSVALDEVIARITYLVEIGLGYLTLDRQSRTLSGGESQRVNLTSILGARLVNTLLVLDEPTIGLHPRDTDRLLKSLRALQTKGNSVLVVEHDPEVIRSADEVIDIGPRAGESGGEVIFQGEVSELATAKNSLTGQYLSGKLSATRKREVSSTPRGSLKIKGARYHNLRNLDVEIPLGRIVMLTGVSGSGKSTLVHKCLHEPYRKLQQGLTMAAIRNAPDAAISDLSGLKHLNDIVFIDQQAIGKSPRSNPATYTKAWDSIRECLAATPAAERLGLSKSAFSFNVEGGRCPNCSGAGQVKIEMQFLADVYVECEVCGGSRFQEQVLGVKFADKSVVDLLAMSIDEAVKLFTEYAESQHASKITKALQPLIDLGLGYLTLGHPLSTVSGGEAQRIKLASYLTEKSNQNYLFILDEPTTGLHPYNINDLLRTFERLIENGHSVLCVEHNLDVIAFADWIIDLGPEGGNGGGQLVFEGTPQDLLGSAKNRRASYTAKLLYEEKKRSKAKTPGKNTSIAKKNVLDISSRSGSTDWIEILHARHHNLKDVSVKIPHNALSVVTGVSGSGKSTLAFDILFAEGQRRYIDCLSPYARQYIKQLSRADVDRVNFIPPTIAVSQKTAPPMGVSTIATTTELYQYLRLLYAKLGTQHCVKDNTPISSMSTDSIAKRIAQDFKGKRIRLFAPVISGRKGYYNELFTRALKAEITEAKIDGKMVSLTPDLRLERHKLHWISLGVASISKPSANNSLLQAAVEQCLLLGNGEVEVYEDVYEEPSLYSADRVCTTCGKGYRELDPQDFSFRSARGVCTMCSGRGRVNRKGEGEVPCPSCHGARISEIGRHVFIGGKRIDEVTAMNAPQMLEFLEGLEFPKRLHTVLDPILHELNSRLKVISAVGLDYLHLDRDASSISGGEAQRLRLARSLGSPLTGVCYVLDEPSIGLHPEDQKHLMRTLRELRDAGNTVVVVEHDEDTILQADYIVDVGPRGGSLGGNIVHSGSLETLLSSEDSLTAAALRDRADRTTENLKNELRSTKASQKKDVLRVQGAHANNLQNINFEIPLGKLSVVIGVSGAGKSSLVHSTLVPAVLEEFEGEKERAEYYPKTWKSIQNLGDLERMIEIDQTPVGKTSTSTPASYLGIFNDIRKIYALLPEAKAQGWTASHFSFNTGKGRCQACGGRGYLTVPMNFMPDAHTPCDTCDSLRYNEETLDVLYQGISIGTLLQKTFREAREILSNHKKISRSLDYVLELGLGYLTLGQPTHTLSGGEAQRLKIARELGLREARNTLYILDEPTTGLHMVDVDKLRVVLDKLVSMGNTVVVIEHNLDIIRSADHLIEVGPGPGEKGGQILFTGSPLALHRSKKKTPTKPHLVSTSLPQEFDGRSQLAVA